MLNDPVPEEPTTSFRVTLSVSLGSSVNDGPTALPASRMKPAGPVTLIVPVVNWRREMSPPRSRLPRETVPPLTVRRLAAFHPLTVLVTVTDAPTLAVNLPVPPLTVLLPPMKRLLA